MHEQHKQEALKWYDNQPKLCGDRFIEEYRSILSELVDQQYALHKQTNMAQRVSHCRKISSSENRVNDFRIGDDYGFTEVEAHLGGMGVIAVQVRNRVGLQIVKGYEQNKRKNSNKGLKQEE